MGNKVVNSTTVKLGIYEESNDSQLAGMLGQVKEFEDGRKFVLCKAGAALVAGVRLQSPVITSLDDALVVQTEAAEGQKDIIVTVTAEHTGYDANALQDGYLVTCVGTDEIGTFYKIKENTAMVAAATATITLYDNLTETLIVTTDKVTVCLNPYKDVIVDVLSAPIVGVPYINVQNDYYFWALFQGFGPATATAATIAAGSAVERVTAGVVQTLATGATVTPIGVAYSANAASHALIVKYY